MENAGDPEQVKRADRLERRRAAEVEARMVAVLSAPEGRGFVWDVLSAGGVFASVLASTPELVYYNAGRQDYARNIMLDAINVAPALYLLMEREARERDEKAKKDAEAAHQSGEGDTEEIDQ